MQAATSGGLTDLIQQGGVTAIVLWVVCDKAIQLVKLFLSRKKSDDSDAEGDDCGCAELRSRVQRHSDVITRHESAFQQVANHESAINELRQKHAGTREEMVAIQGDVKWIRAAIERVENGFDKWAELQRKKSS